MALDTVTAAKFGTYLAGCDGYFETNSTWSAHVAISTTVGIGYGRSNVDVWTNIEPMEDIFNWATLDAQIGIATTTTSGFLFTIPIFNTIWGTPIPNSLGSSTHNPEAILVRYGRFVKNLAAHYHGTITAWEVWNEQNLSGAWAGESKPSPAEYINFLKTAYWILKQDNPSNTVVMGAVAFPESTGRDWLDKFFSLGGANYLDAVNMHPYGSNVQSNPNSAPTVAYNNIHGLMTKYGVNKPLWITETGYAADNFWVGVSTTVNENSKATYLVEAFAYDFSTPGIGVIFWHALRDCSATELAPFLDFGLYNHDLVAFPAATALIGFMDRFLNYVPDGDVSQPGFQIYQFHNGATVRQVAWSTSGVPATGMTIPNIYTKAGIRDMFNTFTASNTVAQFPTVSISTTPIYLEMVP